MVWALPGVMDPAMPPNPTDKPSIRPLIIAMLPGTLSCPRTVSEIHEPFRNTPEAAAASQNAGPNSPSTPSSTPKGTLNSREPMTTRSRPSRSAAAPPAKPPIAPEIRKTVSTWAASLGGAPRWLASVGRNVTSVVDAQLRTATTPINGTSTRQLPRSTPSSDARLAPEAPGGTGATRHSRPAAIAAGMPSSHVPRRSPWTSTRPTSNGPMPRPKLPALM